MQVGPSSTGTEFSTDGLAQGFLLGAPGEFPRYLRGYVLHHNQRKNCCDQTSSNLACCLDLQVSRSSTLSKVLVQVICSRIPYVLHVSNTIKSDAHTRKCVHCAACSSGHVTSECMDKLKRQQKVLIQYTNC